MSNDADARYGREIAIIREKAGAAGRYCRHKLKRVRSLESRRSPELRGRAQMIPRNVCDPDSTTSREKSFVAPADGRLNDKEQPTLLTG